MDFRKQKLSCEQARNRNIIEYLSGLGIEPAKIRGYNFWYYSPFRQERTPSFKVNQRVNRWYDFGEGIGGNLIDFAIRYSGCSVGEFIKSLNDNTAILQPPFIPKENTLEAQTRIIILKEFQLSSSQLLSYLNQRQIPIELAEQYCKEVRYQVGDKIFYAVGFKNNSGGYELRNPYFKGGSSPKDITSIENGAKDVAVFEGFFDFLSFVVLWQDTPGSAVDYLILNGLSLLEKARPVMESYQGIHLYLDNNAAGKKSTAYAKSLSPKYVDQSSLYQNFEDVNDYLCQLKDIPPKICIR